MNLRIFSQWFINTADILTYEFHTETITNMPFSSSLVPGEFRNFSIHQTNYSRLDRVRAAADGVAVRTHQGNYHSVENICGRAIFSINFSAKSLFCSTRTNSINCIFHESQLKLIAWKNSEFFLERIDMNWRTISRHYEFSLKGVNFWT